MARNIFLSYSRKDKDFAKKVAEDLEEAGHDVWWDITDIDGGDRWAKEIQEGLNQSQILVLIVSSNSVVSEWVEKEFLYASSRNMKIVPLIYEHCDLPIWLLNLQYIDISGENYDINFQQILEACEKFGRRSGDAKASPSKISARLTHISPYWLLLLISTFLAIIVTVLLTSPSVKPVAPTPTSSNTSIPTSSNTSTPIPTDTNTHTSTPTIEKGTKTPTPTDEATETLVPSQTSAPPSPSETPTFIGLAPAKTDTSGAEMLLVKAGTFFMGKDTSETDERPAHIVNLDDYYIDKYEVTNADYKVCVDELACDLPKTTTFYVSPTYRNHPVVFVSWENAVAYCEWREARLPTEAEWEKAARGTDAHNYPWGNEFDGDALNFCDVECEYSWADKGARDYYTTTAPVGLFPKGASVYGVLDMAGNIAEWVADWYAEDYYENSPILNPLGPESGTYRVLRGGSWYHRKYDVRTFKRDKLRPNVAYNYTGFRCAADAEQK